MYADHAYEEFNFQDSSFTYSHSVGLSHAYVEGTYRKAKDTLILNSAYQPSDYTLEQFQDSTLQGGFISIQIKEIAYTNQLDVRTRVQRDDYLNFTGRVIHHSNRDIFSDDNDTIVTRYFINRDSINNLEVKVWRKRKAIDIPLNFNSSFLDLTAYPPDLDYVFFQNQKVIFRGKEIILLDENAHPV